MNFVCDSTIFRYSLTDRNLVKALGDYLDNNSQKVYDFFGLKPNNKAKVNIIRTKKQFDNLYKKNNGLSKNYSVPEWIVGFHKNGNINYVSLKDYKNTFHSFKQEDFGKALEFYKKTMLHEYVHFVNDAFNKTNNCNYSEKFLSEGIAVYLSGQMEGKEEIYFNSTIEELLDNKNSNYEQYYFVTKCLVENYGREVVLKALQNKEFARNLLENELFDKTKEMFSQQDSVAKNENNERQTANNNRIVDRKAKGLESEESSIATSKAQTEKFKSGNQDKREDVAPVSIISGEEETSNNLYDKSKTKGTNVNKDETSEVSEEESSKTYAGYIVETEAGETETGESKGEESEGGKTEFDQFEVTGNEVEKSANGSAVNGNMNNNFNKSSFNRKEVIEGVEGEEQSF